MVLDEPDGALLKAPVRFQMIPNRTRSFPQQPVVQNFVVRIVEPELLEFPLQIPVCLRDEQEIGQRGFDRSDCFLPEFFRLFRPLLRRKAPPCPPEHIVQDEHRHVTSHAVAEAGDALAVPRSWRAAAKLSYSSAVPCPSIREKSGHGRRQ